MRFLANEPPPSSDDFWSVSNSSFPSLGPRYGPIMGIGGWKTFALIITTIIILFTVSGNAMTLYAVCKIKTFQNSISNLYIASLAAADMIVGAFVMTFMMLYTIAFDGRWTFGPLMCDVWQSVDFISCTISLYSICAIGFDRWLNLEKPLRIFKRNRFTAKRALAFVWVAPVLIWTPLMVAFRIKNGPPADGTCSFVWKPSYVVPIVAVPLFYVPVFTLMILFVRISLVIRSHLVFLHKHSNQNTATSLFDFDRSAGGSAFGSTPASSRRRSANITPLQGSAGNLKFTGSMTGLNGVNGVTNGNCCRPQIKSKPPPLSPIVSVNLTAPSGGQTTKGDTATAISESSEQQSNNLTCLRSGPPNQSPLAMKVLRDRISPKLDLKKLKTADVDRSPSPIFNFESSDVDKSRKTGDQPGETTPLLRGASTDTVTGSIKNRRSSIATSGSIVDLIKIDTTIDIPNHTPVFFQIGPDEPVGNFKRSASRESIQEAKPELINRNVPSLIDRPTLDQKRSSVTSDTAVFFTKRFLTHKPPLLRAKTEMAIEPIRPKPRPSGRFSIISMASPLFSRRYSMNIFSDMFPHCANGITQQIRAAKAVGVILIFFLISWAPFLVLWPLKTFCPECVSDHMYQVSIWANYLNSTLNPVLYTLCSPRFQRVFRKHFSRCPKAGGTMKSRVEQKRKQLMNNRRNFL